MAGRGHAALWVKLYELELQLRLMRAARGEEGAAAAADDDDEVGDVASRAGAEGACRGRQYDAYMRRRDARRHTTVARAAAASSDDPPRAALEPAAAAAVG
ncbi:hypothetical protein EE612_048092 [Oryza sativa]|nr:hypothetical protein EE612_048092 [Oryza sativa]